LNKIQQIAEASEKEPLLIAFGFASPLVKEDWEKTATIPISFQ
jgi:hypothetical protein